jgi:hypothetical protein
MNESVRAAKAAASPVQACRLQTPATLDTTPLA